MKDRTYTKITRLVLTFRPIKWMLRKDWYSTSRWGFSGPDPLERIWLIDFGAVTFGFAGMQYKKCYRCGDMMILGQAMMNTLVGHDDFGGESKIRPIPRGVTVSRSGPAILVEVMKCKTCGRSITI